METIALICKVLLYFLIASSIAVSKSDTILTSEFLYVTFFFLFESFERLLRSSFYPWYSEISWYYKNTSDVFLFTECCILGGSFQGKHCVF